MRAILSKALVPLVLGATLIAGGSPAGAARPMPDPMTPAATAPYCGITWGSGDKSAGPLSTSPLLSVKTGSYVCWDRVVFESSGVAKGYSVRYRTQVPTEGAGVDLVPYTAGDAFLWVTLREPATNPAFTATTGKHVVNVLGYQTLRDVVYGGSFEGYTTFAVGVRTRLPFRVTLLSGPGQHSRIAVDVAHRW